MPLQFPNSTLDIVSKDPNANAPGYKYNTSSGKWEPIVATTPAFDPSSMYNPQVTTTSSVNPMESYIPTTTTTPPKPEEVSGVPAVTTPTTGLDDTKTGTGRSTETGGVNKNTDTEPIVNPPVNPYTMFNAPPPAVVEDPPVVVEPETVVDDDPFADPTIGRFAEGGQTDTSYDDPGPNYNPQFNQTDTTPVTVPPVVEDPPLSEEDQIIDDTRADNGLEDTMSNEPVEPEVPAGTQAYNSFQQKIQSAISSGQLGGLPSKDEIRADRFLNGDQKTALLNMYPKPPVAETPEVSTQPDAGQTPRVDETPVVSTQPDTGQTDRVDTTVDTIVPLDDTIIPSTGESTEGEADVVPDKVQRTSLNTADLQGWARRASAGEVNIDEIKGLNLTPFQENSLISSYNTGVTNRAAAEQLAIENQKAEEQRVADEAEQARIRQEAADEQQRKQDEIDAAATADEQRKVTARQSLVQGYKDSLLADPDFVIDLDMLRRSDPTAADEIQSWMETSMEYSQAVRDAGLSGSGESKTEVGSEFDVTENEPDAPAEPLTEFGTELDVTKTSDTGTEVGSEFDVTIDEDEPTLDTGTEVGTKWDATDTVEYYDDSPEEPEDINLEQYATITPDLTPKGIKSLVDAGFDTPSIIRAGELHKSDGIGAFNGYLEAVQAGKVSEWEANYKKIMDAKDDDVADDPTADIDPIYKQGTPEYKAAIDTVNIEDLILRLPEPPTDLDAYDKFFWLAGQVDADGNPLLTATEAQAYYEWSKTQQENVDANTSVDGDGGMGDASDPSNLESIQGTIAGEIEKVVKDMGFNSEEYKTSQTTAIDARYEDARVRLGRQFAIDPGGTKTGRAQRAFETIENQRIQDLATLDTEVQDRLQAARDSTITNLVNAFSSITTGKMAEDQLDEQERQFNTELRESVRQFNNDIAIRLKEFGLDETQIEAAVAKINSDMVNNTRAISAEISQAWADITGDVGVPGGLISLEDLGIPESEWSMFPYLPASEDMKDTIKMSFEAMLGRSITNDEMTNLMSNGRIKVDDNMPTQKAREFAATITQQNMDRISQYDAIAESNGLDRDKFTDAKDRADKDWARTNLEVAEEFGLDNNTFRNSMWDLDQRLSKIFFNEDYTEVERDMQRRNAINDVSRLYFPDEQGSFLQAKDQYDVLYGDRERAVAAAFGMDGETFARANRQADIQEERASSVWASAFNNASIRDYSKPDGGGEIDKSWLVESKRWNADNSQFITFRNGVDDWADSVLSVQIASLDIKAPGDSSMGPGIYTPASIVSELMQAASKEEKNQLYTIFQDFADGRLMNDTILEENLLSYITSAYSPDGDHKLSGARVSGDGTIKATKERPFFKLKAIDRNWFQSLTETEQTAMMSLINGSNFSPEREAGGVSALSSIGRAFGIGAGAYLGYKAGGTEGIAPGAAAGAAATSGLP
jgi:hypothetical protein